MRVVATGISGSGRNEYISSVAEYARTNEKDLAIFEVGSMMFSLADSQGIKIPEEKILDLSPSTLNYLRTTVFERILRDSQGFKDVVISTHACFRWRKHLLQGLDFHYLGLFNPDMYVNIIDEVIPICFRMDSTSQWRSKLNPLDVLTWRDEEIFVTKSIAEFQRKPFYVIPRKEPPETLYKLIYEKQAKKAYLSYPMTHIEKEYDRIREKDRFRDDLRSRGMIVFDPGQIDDVSYLNLMMNARSEGRQTADFIVEGNKYEVGLGDLDRIRDTVYDQIVARDYQLIDQSDILVVYYYLQVMSPGVLSEMSYGFMNSKDVLVVFKGPESPFFHYYSTNIFKNEDDILSYLRRRGYIH